MYNPYVQQEIASPVFPEDYEKKTIKFSHFVLYFQLFILFGIWFL